MQFKVPQFLDIEDKIFGPFTFKQFVYLAGGGGLCFILYKLMGFFVAFLPMAGIAAFSLALAFYKPNNKPFVNMLEAWFKYFMQSKLYVWKKEKEEEKQNATMKKEVPEEILPPTKKLDGSKLRDLAWSLDVLDLDKK
jgi:hypothetical protein